MRLTRAAACLALLPAASAVQAADPPQSESTGTWKRARSLLWRVDRELNVRFNVNNALPSDALSSTRVDDLDGFAASADTRPQTVTLFNAGVQWRY